MDREGEGEVGGVAIPEAEMGDVEDTGTDIEGDAAVRGNPPNSDCTVLDRLRLPGGARDSARDISCTSGKLGVKHGLARARVALHTSESLCLLERG